jgi:hypothetical protein
LFADLCHVFFGLICAGFDVSMKRSFSSLRFSIHAT